MNLWQAKIKAEIPGDAYPSTSMCVRDFIRDNPVRIASIYMFTKVKILNPIYAGLKNDGQIFIHPGWNRYIGASLKDEETWLDARICVRGNTFPGPNVRWEKIITSVKGKDPIAAALALGQKELGKGSQMEAKDFLIKNSNNARIELKLEDKVIVFNPLGTWVISADIQEHNGIIPSLKAIYKIVDNLSGERNEH
jgi:FMN-dependent NADH-azoreductase